MREIGGGFCLPFPRPGCQQEKADAEDLPPHKKRPLTHVRLTPASIRDVGKGPCLYQ